MTQFDFLHDPRRAVLRRALDLRVPAGLANALFALAGSVFVLSCVWGIEVYRLRVANDVQMRYQARFDRSVRELARTKVAYGRLQRAVELDKQIIAIERSGHDEARRLAEIANRLPAHSWLTSISRDATGIAIEGRARDLTVVGRTLGDLARSALLQNPTLLDASAASQTSDNVQVRYRLHLDDSRR